MPGVHFSEPHLLVYRGGGGGGVLEFSLQGWREEQKGTNIEHRVCPDGLGKRPRGQHP